MGAGDAVDDLGVIRRVFENRRFELKQPSDVTGGSRGVPSLKEGGGCGVTVGAQLAVLGYQIVDERDPS